MTGTNHSSLIYLAAGSCGDRTGRWVMVRALVHAVGAGDLSAGEAFAVAREAGAVSAWYAHAVPVAASLGVVLPCRALRK